MINLPFLHNFLFPLVNNYCISFICFFLYVLTMSSTETLHDQLSRLTLKASRAIKCSISVIPRVCLEPSDHSLVGGFSSFRLAQLLLFWHLSSPSFWGSSLFSALLESLFALCHAIFHISLVHILPLLSLERMNIRSMGSKSFWDFWLSKSVCYSLILDG